MNVSINSPPQILGDSDTSLLLSLKHPLPSVRSLAVEHLTSLLSSGQVRGRQPRGCSCLVVLTCPTPLVEH